MKLIDKDALMAEIEKLKAYLQIPNAQLDAIKVCDNVISVINALEVKEVEEPNASDRGMAEEIIINLKRVEQDYRIDLTKEIEWLRNKIKKGK